MTISVSEDLASGPYDGNDVTTVFDYGFTIYDADELVVTKLEIGGLAQTILTRTTHYTVSPSGGSYPAAGTITLLTPLATGEKLTIEPGITRSQDRPFSNQGTISLEELEAAYDKLTSLVRQLIYSFGRTLNLSAFEAVADAELPLAEGGKFLGWNAAGDAIENKTPNTGDFITVPLSMGVNEIYRSSGDPAVFEGPTGLFADGDGALRLESATPIITFRDTDLPAGAITEMETVGAVFTLDVDPTGDAVSPAYEVKVGGTTKLRVDGDRALTISSTDAVKIPVGTTAQRPAAPVIGDTRQNSTLGQAEIYDGTAWNKLAVGFGWKTRTILTTASASPYVPPTGCKAIRVLALGAGGGGGGVDGTGSGSSICGGGGGAGALVDKFIDSLAASYTFVVGVKGAGGAAGNNNGAAGTATTFSDGAGLSLQAGAGSGGTAASSRRNDGGDGGTGSGGDINTPGNPGLAGLADINTGFRIYEYGLGGPTPYGAPGNSGRLGVTAAAALGYGAGGNGAANANDVGNLAGGDGSDGLIIIEELY